MFFLRFRGVFVQGENRSFWPGNFRPPVLASLTLHKDPPISTKVHAGQVTVVAIYPTHSSSCPDMSSCLSVTLKINYLFFPLGRVVDYSGGCQATHYQPPSPTPLLFTLSMCCAQRIGNCRLWICSYFDAFRAACRSSIWSLLCKGKLAQN